MEEKKKELEERKIEEEQRKKVTVVQESVGLQCKLGEEEEGELRRVVHRQTKEMKKLKERSGGQGKARVVSLESLETFAPTIIEQLSLENQELMETCTALQTENENLESQVYQLEQKDQQNRGSQRQIGVKDIRQCDYFHTQRVLDSPVSSSKKPTE